MSPGNERGLAPEGQPDATAKDHRTTASKRIIPGHAFRIEEAVAEATALHAIGCAVEAVRDWEAGRCTLGATIAALADAVSIGERVALQAGWGFLAATADGMPR